MSQEQITRVKKEKSPVSVAVKKRLSAYNKYVIGKKTEIANDVSGNRRYCNKRKDKMTKYKMKQTLT